MKQSPFEQLDELETLRVTLENFNDIPNDAVEILNSFKRTTPSLESISFDTKKVALEGIADKAKALVVQAIKWIKYQIQEFIKFIASGKLEIGTVRKELEQIKTTSADGQYQTENITLSPAFTGRIAINGILDETFPNNIVRVRGIVDLLLDLQPAAIKATNVIVEIVNSTGVSGKNSKIVEELAKFSQHYGRKLVATDTSKSLVGLNRFTQENTLGKAGMKIQDMTSLPLPGGYTLVGALMNVASSFNLSPEDEEKDRLASIVSGLIDTMKPALVKTVDSGVTFKGKPLNASGAKKIIDESEEILSLLEREFSSDSEIKGALSKIEGAISKAAETHRVSLEGLVKNLSSLTKFVELDRSKITRYVLGVIRASVRYIHASLITKEVVEPAGFDRGLPSPAAN